MTIKIATWNVNSICARLPTALAVLKALDADIVCLQELKCEDARFPELELSALGYTCAVFGQKTYNGVAILSRFALEDVSRGLPGFEDPASRYIEAVVSAPGGMVRVASIYLPNGNPVQSDKFGYKLGFFEKLIAHAQGLLALEEICVLAGDYNVIPREVDCHDPRAWANDALFQPESRGAYRALQNLGYTDAYMQADGAPHKYTFWDYQAGAWQKDNGVRIDHLLLSPQAADRLARVEIKKDARAMDKPSDHVPIAAVLAI